VTAAYGSQANFPFSRPLTQVWDQWLVPLPQLWEIHGHFLKWKSTVSSTSTALRFFVQILWTTPSVSKYLHLLTSALHVWPFVLFEKIVKILFILLWHVLSSYIFEVHHNCFYISTNFLNKTNDQTVMWRSQRVQIFWDGGSRFSSSGSQAQFMSSLVTAAQQREKLAAAHGPWAAGPTCHGHYP
jgi:hypothetical protein